VTKAHLEAEVHLELSNDRTELIALKNSKIRLPHFSVNFHCFIKVDFTCQERAMTDPHIAEPAFWPTP
jgi:hypothetical protein